MPFRPAKWYTNDDCQNESRRRVVSSEPRAVLVDVFKWLCPRRNEQCNPRLGAMPLRPDGMHFRHASARLLAAFVVAQAKGRGVLLGVRDDTPEAKLLAPRPTP